MMEQVRLCVVWPTENWLGSSLNQILGWMTVRESYSCALELGPLPPARAARLFYVNKSMTGADGIITHQSSAVLVIIMLALVCTA